MARVRAILAALWTALRRDKSLGSFSSNNLFLVSVLLLFLKDPGAFLVFNLFIGLVLFLPLSSNPLRKVPKSRLAIWPLAARESHLLPIASIWLNPVTWLLVALALWKSVTWGLWALLAGLFTIGFVGAGPEAGATGLWRRMPDLPGPLDQLIRKNLRELLSTLDFYSALLLAVAGLILRVAHLLPQDALLPMTMLVMLSISTYAQNLFGLDGDEGLTRYRLLPSPGWQILAAKDLAFALVALLLSLPLDPLAGLAAALTALAVGHHASVNQRREQARWRFSTGMGFGGSIFQVVLMTLAAAGTTHHPLILAAPIAAYTWSTWWYGRTLERRAQ
jgi:hypothetical protein